MRRRKTVGETEIVGLLFPGQGSQSVGMGRALADTHPPAAEAFAEADEVVGIPLSRLAWDGPEEELVQTHNVQPAILVHSIAVLRSLGDRLPPAAMAAGHSLGEFSAHVAAGTLTFPDAVRAVRLRGELMFEAGRARPGTMAAVLGLDDGEVERVCGEASDGGTVCVPANYNAAGQVVISGDVAAVEKAAELAGEAGARKVVGLNVSGAFHSPLMEPAEDGLRGFLEEIPFRDPAFPVISNVTAEPVESGARARELLVRQLTSPVRWAVTVRTMVDEGIDRFFELGPGSVLCGLNRRNARGMECRSIGNPEDIPVALKGSASLGSPRSNPEDGLDGG